MSKQFQIHYKSGKLRLNSQPTFPQFVTEFQSRLKLFVDSTKLRPLQVGQLPGAPLLGTTTQSRTTAKYDKGPMLDATDHLWHYWRDDLAEYVPTRQVIKDAGSAYLVELGAELLVSDADRTATFQNKNGTIALTSQIFVPRPAETLDTVSGVVTIDSTPTPGPGILEPFGRDMFIFKLKVNTSLFALFMNDGEVIDVAIVNEGTAYTFDWSGLVKWPNNTAPAAPVSAGGSTAVGIYELRKIGTSFYGRAKNNTGSSTMVDVGGVIPGPAYGYTPTSEREKNLP